jgi:hypothetical protein
MYSNKNSGAGCFVGVLVLMLFGFFYLFGFGNIFYFFPIFPTIIIFIIIIAVASAATQRSRSYKPKNHYYSKPIPTSNPYNAKTSNIVRPKSTSYEGNEDQNCQECGTKLNSGAVFCQNCGSRRISIRNIKIESDENGEDSDRLHYCPYCGTKTDKDAQFCHQCGTKL